MAKVLKLFFAFGALALLHGCIADAPADSDLPWASNKSWEGVAPIVPSVMDRYE